MKKLLVLTLMLGSFGFFGFGATETQAATVAGGTPQVRIQLGSQRNRSWYRNRNRRVRTVRQTRIVRYGRRTYRETYLVRYFGNGQRQTTLLSRERIG